jgi:hypothetical protein
MRYPAVLVMTVVLLTPGLPVAQSTAADDTWSDQQQQWLETESVDAFKALMTDLSKQSLLSDARKRQLEKRLNTWAGDTGGDDAGAPNITVDGNIQTVGYGQMKTSTIRTHIEHHALNSIKSCYKRHLTSAPEAEGKVAVTFDIQTDGNISDIETVETTLGSDVGACVSSSLSDVTFPRPKGGTLTVRRTFLFGLEYN